MSVADILAQLGYPQLLHLFSDEKAMVTNVGTLALMEREDYADLQVPLGPTLKIMAACKQLMGQQ
jgi:hypothetical protein